MSTDEDYYKPAMTNGAFNNNYIQYESQKDKVKNLSIKKYLDIIRPYLSDIKNDHKTQGRWRIHSGNNMMDGKTRNNVKITMFNETNEIIMEHFKYFLQKYQERLEELMRRSGFIFDSADALYYDLYKISLIRDE